MEDISVQKQETKILIAGPCVIEDWDTCYQIASELKRLARIYRFSPVFKGSWDKANRTSADGFRGIEKAEALEILARIRRTFGIFTITDVHETDQVEEVSKYVDMLQVPAFLCRQTDLIEKCASSGKITMVKKGQFLSHSACSHIESKFYKAGGTKMIICERGNTFGYNDLIVDVTSISKLRKFCKRSLVALDCTHSLQKPNGAYGKTGGESDYIEDMVKFGAVMGADVLFIETHPNPKSSPSDSENMLELSKLESVIAKAKNIYDAE